MDFQRVEKPYRCCAFFVQLGLLSSLIFYVILQFTSIVFSSSEESVPVKVTMEPWKGAGVWAICDSPLQPRGLIGTGFAIPNITSHDFAGMPYVSYRHWPLTLQEVEFEGDTLDCSIVDLSKEKIKPPFIFTLCAAPAYVSYILSKTKTDDGEEWKIAQGVVQGQYKWINLQKKQHGWNFGYEQTTSDFHTFSLLQEDCCSPRNVLCGSDFRWFGSENSRVVAAMVISIDEPLVTVTRYQGLLPRVFTLLGELGGYLALLTTIFTIVFVKKYPASGVAEIFEARTFIGERVKDFLQGHGSEEKNKHASKPLPLPPGLFKNIGRETE